MNNYDYSFEKKFLMNKLINIKKDILGVMTDCTFKKVKYDMLNSVELAIEYLKKYDLILEKEIEDER